MRNGSPGYEPERALAALTDMKAKGYNVVRVFISDSNIGSSAGGLSLGYMQNVADFLQKAKSKNIYVMLTIPLIPKEGGYYVANQNPDFIEDINWFYLSSEGIEAKKRYTKDFINNLIRLNAPMDAILSYNIENEAYFMEDKKPFSLTLGRVTTANGQTYDLSNLSQKQQMMDSNLVYWINQVRAAILEVDPTALVAPGFFSPVAVGGSDPRVIRTYWPIQDPDKGGSNADYIDLHYYPGFRSVIEEMNSFEIVGNSNKKPLLMGEFGTYKSIYSSVSNAAIAAKTAQIESCPYGFDGWSFWTWDTTEQPELYNAVESSGVINSAVAPVYRPDPCK